MKRVPPLMNRVGSKLIQELDLRSGDLMDEESCKIPLHQAYLRMTHLDPQQLGILAACGKGVYAKDEDESARRGASLYNVHCGTWLGKYESGLYLLQQIAATAVVAHVRDRLARSR